MRDCTMLTAAVCPIPLLCLLQGSLLQTHYMHNLQNVVFEPFAAYSMPGLPAAQTLAVQASLNPSAAGVQGAGAVAASSGRDPAIQQ